MIVFFVGGYARSGKTSLMLELEKHKDIQVMSTSRVLDEFVDKIHPAMGLPVPVEHEERRAAKIAIAESALVPVFTRKCLTNAVVDQLDPRKAIAVFETIGGNEYELAYTALRQRFAETDVIREVHNINIRRAGEKAGIDIRKLLPFAIELWNTHATTQEWAESGVTSIREIAYRES